MKVDLSFWRFVVIVAFATSLLWGKDEDTYWFHIGTFTDGENTAVKVLLLPFSLCLGFIKKENL
tara:strand:- start:434 stop:625 length:192 start_codon:yes stop_codon:yes gene_type:complete